MKHTHIGLLSVASVLLLSQPASALFVNGGFEDGTTNGWIVDAGRSVNGDAVNWSLSGSGTGSGRADVIDATGSMPGQTLDVDPFNGNYMVRINDIYGNYDATKISQTDQIDQQDIDDGSTVYVNWGAMLIEPSNTHPTGAQPFFAIDVSVNGTNVGSFSADATDHSINSDWVNAGSYGGSSLWYNHDTWSFDLSSYMLGDSVTIDMWVSDCNWGAHGGYAFLDGVGTVDPGGEPVPEPSTMLLMGAGLLGLLGYRRKRSNNKS